MNAEIERPSGAPDGEAEPDLLLKDTAGALYLLFFATVAAVARYDTLKASLTTEAEREAFKAVHIGLISFDPPPPAAIERLLALEGLAPASALSADAHGLTDHDEEET